MFGNIGPKNLQQALSQALVPSAYQGVVGNGSTTSNVLDSMGGWTANQWTNWAIQFAPNTPTVALQGVWQQITGNAAAGLTLAAALPAVPAAGDIYNIRPFGQQLLNIAQIGGAAQSGGDWTPKMLGVAQDGTDAAGVVPPAGGSGIRGWLSGLYNLFVGGTAKMALSGRNLTIVVLQNAATVASVGTPFTVGGNTTLTFEVTFSGTATGTVVIQGAGTSGMFYNIGSVINLTTNAAASQITASGLYQVDITGLDKVQANIPSMTPGTGNINVNGKAVA